MNLFEKNINSSIIIKQLKTSGIPQPITFNENIVQEIFSVINNKNKY